jgi:hypothetical protein
VDAAWILREDFDHYPPPRMGGEHRGGRLAKGMFEFENLQGRRLGKLDEQPRHMDEWPVKAL